MRPRQRFLATAVALSAALCASAWVPAGRFVGAKVIAPPFRALIVGGGPDMTHNQVAIESNVRYVSKLLPASVTPRVLFTDGNPESKNVLCEDADKKTYYRTPQIPKIDGPSDLDHVKSEISSIATDLASNPTAPVLFYFTGHGSPNSRSEYNNNRYDLWNNKGLSVKNLATSLKALPKQAPVAVVMVECFSGAFGNLLFEGGEPEGPLADLNICGFFASVSQREAAGCTPEINEANYRDFTSFFFAALSGVDRLGKPVKGADYNHDGKVGMNEAYAYALIHDDSIDTPVCTSDVFLRRFVKTPDRDVVATPFPQIQAWASPSQLVALNALSKSIDMASDDRLSRAYQKFIDMNPASMETYDVHLIRFIRLAKSVVLAHTLTTSNDEANKARYAALILAESANPLR